MMRVLSSILLVVASASSVGAQTLQTPTAEQETEEGKTVFAVEQRVRDKPLRIEQSCPPPETVDVFASSTWNSVEIGISLPLGENAGEFKLYTRYTCPAPAVKAGR